MLSRRSDSNAEIWLKFVSNNNIIETGAPLFECHDNGVETIQYSTNQGQMLRRSATMESLVIQEVE